MATDTSAFRPHEQDRRIPAESGENATATNRGGSRVPDHERWLVQFRADAAALRDEDLNAEPDTW